ncbi:hypothetical protein IWQ61_000656 [Dispira simplex]|nr:hypothetical protein IWQ61_000656 [Dispira simplex]
MDIRPSSSPDKRFCKEPIPTPGYSESVVVSTITATLVTPKSMVDHTHSEPPSTTFLSHPSLPTELVLTPATTPTPPTMSTVDLTRTPVSLLFESDQLAEHILKHLSNDQLQRLVQLSQKIYRHKAGTSETRTTGDLILPIEVSTSLGQLHLQSTAFVDSGETLYPFPSITAEDSVTMCTTPTGANTPSSHKRKASELGEDSQASPLYTATLREHVVNRLAQDAHHHQQDLSLSPSRSGSIDVSTGHLANSSELTASLDPSSALTTPLASNSPSHSPAPDLRSAPSAGELTTIAEEYTSNHQSLSTTSPTNGSSEDDLSSFSQGQVTLAPSTTITEQTIDGIQWIQFTYTTKGVTSKYSVRVDIEQVNIEALNHDFKQRTAIYPRAYVPYTEYKGNRWNYETECNRLAWALAHLNPQLTTEKRGILQRAVDSYRNRRPDLKSRRVVRQEKLNNGTLRPRSSSRSDSFSAQGAYFLNGGTSSTQSTPGSSSSKTAPSLFNPTTLNRFNRKKSASLSVNPTVTSHYSNTGFPLNIVTQPGHSVPFAPMAPMSATFMHRRGASAAAFPLMLPGNGPTTAGLLPSGAGLTHSGNSSLTMSFGMPGTPGSTAMAHSMGMTSPIPMVQSSDQMGTSITGSPNTPNHSLHRVRSRGMTTGCNQTGLLFAHEHSTHTGHPLGRRRATVVEAQPIKPSFPSLENSMLFTTHSMVQSAGLPSHTSVLSHGLLSPIGESTGTIPSQSNNAPLANGFPQRLVDTRTRSLSGTSAYPETPFGVLSTMPDAHSMAQPTSNQVGMFQSQLGHLVNQIPMTPRYHTMSVVIHGQSTGLTLRIDIENVPPHVLTDEFKAAHAVYPKAYQLMVDPEGHTKREPDSTTGQGGNGGTTDEHLDSTILQKQMFINEIGWRLVCLNSNLLGQTPDLTRQVVAEYQNLASNPELNAAQWNGFDGPSNGIPGMTVTASQNNNPETCPRMQTSISASAVEGCGRSDTLTLVSQDSPQRPASYDTKSNVSYHSRSSSNTADVQQTDLISRHPHALQPSNLVQDAMDTVVFKNDSLAFPNSGSELHTCEGGVSATMELDYYVHTL